MLIDNYRYTSDWTSWENRWTLYKQLQPGDILQQKMAGYGPLPQMEHWVLVLGFDDNRQPAIVHLVNNDPSSSIPSGWSSGSLTLAVGGSVISGGLSSNAPLVSSAGSSLATPGSAALSPQTTLASGSLLMSSGGLITGSALVPFISAAGGGITIANVLALIGNGGVGLFLLIGGGIMLASAGSSLSSQSSSKGQSSSPIQWAPLESLWVKGREFRKHNFKDREWTPAPMETILERVYSEYKAAKPYSLMKNNCEQFVHFCRFGKRYSGQVAAFSKSVKWWTLGLVRVYDEFD